MPEGPDAERQLAQLPVMDMAPNHVGRVRGPELTVRTRRNIEVGSKTASCANIKLKTHNKPISVHGPIPVVEMCTSIPSSSRFPRHKHHGNSVMEGHRHAGDGSPGTRGDVI